MMRSKLFSGLLCALLFVSTFLLPVKLHADTVSEAQSLADGIVSYQLQQNGADSVQDWIYGGLTANAGITSEWYILALSQSGGSYDFSTYTAALQQYLAGTNAASASSRQKYALALIAAGSSDPWITETLNNSIGQQGIMSWVYGLHLLNNGYASEGWRAEDIVNTILSLQLADGGWALSGTVSDVDVTAMTLQALAPYYGQHGAAIDRSLELLSQRQLEEGDFASYGVPNPESTAQVITALAALGIDACADARFIKNGNTLLDGMAKYRLADGSFSHTLGGAYNYNATVQVYYALTAYSRQRSGRSSLYLLDHRNPAGLNVPAPTEPPAPVQTEPAVPSAPVQDETLPATAETSVSTEAETTGSETSGSAEETTTRTETAVSSSCIETSTVLTEAAAAGTTAEQPASEEKVKNPGGYKLPVTLVLIGTGGAVCLVLFLVKRRHPKNFIAVLIVTAVGIAFVWLTEFRSAQDYYSGETASVENTAGTVTMTIRCDTVLGKSDADYIPADGVILETTEFAIAEGDTVFDILTAAAQSHQIQMEYSGSPEMAYVSGIGYLYEFDFGDLSGWVYHVNGASPSVGCGEYTVADGDVIEWLYSCQLGEDVE